MIWEAELDNLNPLVNNFFKYYNLLDFFFFLKYFKSLMVQSDQTCNQNCNKNCNTPNIYFIIE